MLDLNFKEVYLEYFEYSKTQHKKQGYETLNHDFNKHVMPYFENRDVETITRKDLLDWKLDISSKNFSNNYNSLIFRSFSAFLDYCVLCGYIKENELLLIGRFKRRSEIKNHDVYTMREFLKFRRGLDDFVYKMFFTFMYYNGTRPSEAMALRFVDVKGRDVYIRHSICRHGKRELDTPKNNSSIRFLKISLTMELGIYLLKKYYLKKYGIFKDDYFVFGGSKPLAPTTIDRKKEMACKKSHIRPITQHEFRHSYATRKLHLGVSIDKISRSMGHSKVTTTLDVYVHGANEKSAYKALSSKFN